MRLIDFAQAPDQDYRWLQQQIDALPEGRTFYFENCELPAGCVPANATVGLYKASARYAMFLEGSVRYSGSNRAMINLSRGPHLFFRNFSEMKRFLQTLPREPDSPETAPEQEEDACDLNTVINAEEISLPQRTALSATDYQTIQREMEKQIIGQKNAVETIAHQVSLHLNKSNPKKPLSIIAYGPPGTGKSESAKSLAKILSRLGPHEYSTVWTELNTFTEAHSVYRLTGSPPGYVGYDDKPVFEAVANNPYTVFIFDELDKAHPEVLKTFMSILDEGRCAARKELADQSREYNFRHCIFFFTSNFRLGGKDNKTGIGFTISDDIVDIRRNDDAVEISYRENEPEDNFDTVTKRIFHDTEAARAAFVKAGVLREIASRFNCFVEFQELCDEAKIGILAKQVIETGFEYDIKLTYISSEILQSLVDASMSENVLTVRSFKSVIEGYLAAAFAEAGARCKGQAVRLEGTIEAPEIVD